MTRDQQRQAILELIATEWEGHPDLRFGQLVENFIRPPWEDQPTEQQHWEHCIFNTTDEVALKRLQEGLPG